MDESRRWRSGGPDDTARIGRELAALLPRGAIVQLTGNLGAGKTTLSKALVEAWGVAPAEEVSSPTFTLIQEYGEPVGVYHVDLYRLEEARELRSLGLEDLFYSGPRVLIEWGEKFSSHLPPDRWIVRIEDTGGDSRVIELNRF